MSTLLTYANPRNTQVDDDLYYIDPQIERNVDSTKDVILEADSIYVGITCSFWNFSNSTEPPHSHPIMLMLGSNGPSDAFLRTPRLLPGDP